MKRKDLKVGETYVVGGVKWLRRPMLLLSTDRWAGVTGKVVVQHSSGDMLLARAYANDDLGAARSLAAWVKANPIESEWISHDPRGQSLRDAGFHLSAEPLTNIRCLWAEESARIKQEQERSKAERADHQRRRDEQMVRYNRAQLTADDLSVRTGVPFRPVEDKVVLDPAHFELALQRLARP